MLYVYTIIWGDKTHSIWRMQALYYEFYANTGILDPATDWSVARGISSSRSDFRFGLKDRPLSVVAGAGPVADRIPGRLVAAEVGSPATGWSALAPSHSDRRLHRSLPVAGRRVAGVVFGLYRHISAIRIYSV